MDPLQDIVNQLKIRKPQAIILFGSYAWGKPNQDSDIDLLIIEKTNKPFSDRIRDVHRSLTGSIPVDVIVLHPEEVQKVIQANSFYRQVISEGKVVYGRI